MQAAVRRDTLLQPVQADVAQFLLEVDESSSISHRFFPCCAASLNPRPSLDFAKHRHGSRNEPAAPSAPERLPAEKKHLVCLKIRDSTGGEGVVLHTCVYLLSTYPYLLPI